MELFRNIQQCLEYSERIESLLAASPRKIKIGSKEKREIVSLWLQSLFSLIKKDPDRVPKREPLLFILVDKITLENKSLLFRFLKDLKEVKNHPFLQEDPKKYQQQLKIIEIIIPTLLDWERLSQNFFEEARKNLSLIETSSRTKTFFFMIREFHPRKIQGKHPWNEIQISSLRELSIEEILAKNSEDPLSGNRFFILEDEGLGPATGVGIKTGHHRVYELYRRFINGMLENICFQGKCNGDILLVFLKKD